MSDLPTIVSFWHGPLGWLEKLCLTSFVRQGHAVALYSYEAPADMPAGIVWRDAAQIIPQDEMFFYKGKHTPAVFADLFRLHLMQEKAGIWVDCDVYCLKPFKGLGDYVLGYEIAPNAQGKNGSVNNAVFKIPAESALLQHLLAVFDPKNVGKAPPWLPLTRRIEVWLRTALGQKLAPQDIQFGATGPFPLTWYVNKLGLREQVSPVSTFYPVPYATIPELMRAGSDIDDFTTEQSFAVHIWRSQLTGRGRSALPQPEANSALAKLCVREGIKI